MDIGDTHMSNLHIKVDRIKESLASRIGTWIGLAVVAALGALTLTAIIWATVTMWRSIIGG